MNASRKATVIAFLALLAGLSFAAIAQSSRPAAKTSTSPTSLDAFDREIRQLFEQSQARVVRAQVPIHISTEHPLFKWRLQLDPRLREQLDRARERGEAPQLFVEPARPTTAPAPPADTDRVPLPTAVINIEYVGLVLNDRGDVLLPLYIDKAYLKGSLSVSVDDRAATTAQVVAADDKTRLTVIRLDQPAGEPVRFAPQRPLLGSLVLMVSPTRRAARLAVWAGGQDDNAILFDRAGDVAGLVRNGHVLHAATLAPLVDQLLTTGRVRRPKLGATIRDVPPDDPRRVQQPALGSRPAARVEKVDPGSLAESIGLRAADLILSLGGEPVEDVMIFGAVLAARSGPTELRVLRDGAELELTVDLQPR